MDQNKEEIAYIFEKRTRHGLWEKDERTILLSEIKPLDSSIIFLTQLEFEVGNLWLN